MFDKGARYLYIIFVAVFPALVLCFAYQGRDDVISYPFVMGYAWPVVLLVACAVFFASYMTDSIKVTTVGALIAAVGMALSFDWLSVDLGSVSIGVALCLASVIAMVASMLSFSWIWLSYNELTIPKGLKRAPLVLGAVACLLLIVPSEEVFSGDMLFMFVVMLSLTIVIEMFSDDLAGEKSDGLREEMFGVFLGQILIIAVVLPFGSGWYSETALAFVLAVLSCGNLIDCAKGSDQEASFFEGLKRLTKRWDLMPMFVLQVVMAVCLLWYEFYDAASASNAALVSQVVFGLAVATGLLAMLRVSFDEKSKKTV